jgi:hypothetical protein
MCFDLFVVCICAEHRATVGTQVERCDDCMGLHVGLSGAASAQYPLACGCCNFLAVFALDVRTCEIPEGTHLSTLSQVRMRNTFLTTTPHNTAVLVHSRLCRLYGTARLARWCCSPALAVAAGVRYWCCSTAHAVAAAVRCPACICCSSCTNEASAAAQSAHTVHCPGCRCSCCSSCTNHASPLSPTRSSSAATSAGSSALTAAKP